MNERDKLLQATSPRLNDPAGVDPLIITASTTVLKFEVDPANPLNIIPANGTVVLYALCDRPGDISWSIVGEPISGVSLSSNTGNTVTLTYTSSLAVEGIVISASATNNLYSPATLTKQLTLSRQVPAKTIKNVEVFKRSSTALTSPTGGSYVFSTNSITAPIGWSITIPVGTDPVYVSRTQVSSYSSSSSTPITIVESWSSPAVLAQNGAKGDNGNDGRRGSVDIAVIGSTWTSTAADTAIYNATGSYTKYAGDKVTIYNNSGFAETHYWDGISSWVTGQIIDGNLLVSGTVTSDKIGTNTISAANINVTKSGWNPGTGSTTVRYNGTDYTVFSPSIFNNTNTNSGLAHAGMSGKVTGLGSYMLGVSGVVINSGSGAAAGIHGNSYGSGFTYGGVFNGGTADLVLSGSGKIQWGGAVPPILPPDGSTTKYLRADGTWATVSGGSSGVTSFNSRTGAVTLNSTDVANAVAGTGVTLQANITGSAGSAGYASSAGNASTLGGYDTTYYIRGTGPMATGAKTLVGYLPVIGGGTNVFIAIYL